jgi:hypothetical protein
MKSTYMKFSLEYIVPPQHNFRGLSYGDWASVFWKWLLSDLAQGGSVYFLRGNVDLEAPIVRTEREMVTIYSDTGIFFPIICTVTSKLDHPKAISDMIRREHSADSERKPLALRAVIDNIEIPNPENYYAETPEFILSAPKSYPLRRQFKPIFRTGKAAAVSAGYWILLRPLPIGEHTINFEGADKDGFKTSGIYSITVVERPIVNTKVI